MQHSQTHDAFLWTAWAWLEKNRKQVGLVFAAAVVLGSIIWLFVNLSAQKKISAGQAVSRVVVAQALDQSPQGTPPAETPEVYLKTASEYAGTAAGARALLLGAAALFAQGKYAEAQAQFEKFIPQYGDHPMMSQALLGIAASLDAQNKTNDALNAYKNIIDRHPNQPVVPQAKVALARLYEGQSKPELALPLLEDVARTDPYGSIGAEAGMLAEELKQKHPNLVPPVVAATNSTPSIVISTNLAPTSVLKAAAPGTAPAAPAGTKQ
jgi:tetratricopeptide (TPR) repeat protein